jgi:hypothetical protein
MTNMDRKISKAAVLKNKHAFFISSVIVLTCLTFLFSGTVVSASNCQVPLSKYSVSLFLNNFAGLAEKVIKDFGFNVALATAPDPDICGSDNVVCSGNMPQATISWNVAPSPLPDTWSVLSEYDIYLDAVLIGHSATNSFTIPPSIPLANSTTYSWNINAHYIANWCISLDGSNVCGTTDEPSICTTASLGSYYLADCPSGIFTTPNCAPPPPPPPPPVSLNVTKQGTGKGTVTSSANYSQAFNYTGGAQTWTVPTGIISINVDVKGAQGASGQSGVGGLGGRVQATLAVTPGETLSITVGGSSGWPGGGAQGSVACGYWGGNGGGYTKIAGGTNSAIAGGGGGGTYGGYLNGGDGGYPNGTDGVGNPIPTPGSIPGGGGGTQSAGGIGYQIYAGYGSFGQGGYGGTYPGAAGGGGGGGGYYGGGGGSSGFGGCYGQGAGGGGGSSWTDGSSVTYTTGYQGGNGQVIINYTSTDINCGSACPGASASFKLGTAVTLTANPDPSSIFAGWSGDADCSDGKVTMNSAVNCIATFNLIPLIVGTVNLNGYLVDVSTCAQSALGALAASSFLNMTGPAGSGWTGTNATPAAYPNQPIGNYTRNSVSITAPGYQRASHCGFTNGISASDPNTKSLAANGTITFSAYFEIAPPAAPTVLTAPSGNCSQITLQWTDNSNNESGFKIERSPDGTTGWTQVGTTGAGVNTFTNTGLTQSTTYYYRVRAWNDSGDSAYSNTISRATLICPVAIFKVVLDPSSIKVGGTTNAKAYYDSGDGTGQHDVTASSVWSSDKPAKATVASGGLVTGVAPGSASISAIYNSNTDSAIVTVSFKPFWQEIIPW